MEDFRQVTVNARVTKGSNKKCVGKKTSLPA